MLVEEVCMEEWDITRRNTQDANEIEPKIPESASGSGSGGVAHMLHLVSRDLRRLGTVHDKDVDSAISNAHTRNTEQKTSASI